MIPAVHLLDGHSVVSTESPDAILGVSLARIPRVRGGRHCEAQRTRMDNET